jgi:hypothetical protein
MEKIRIITVVLLMSLGLSLEARAQGSRLLRFSEPVQVVDTVRFDGGAIQLRYPFENVSGKTVTVLEVHSTCGCFTGEVVKRSLKPGEKTVLKATLDPHSLYGPQKRHLTVLATDGEGQEVLSSVTVEGYVLRDESLGEIRYAEHLGRGLRTDASFAWLTLDKFGDYVFSFPLYNDTDREMTVRVEGPSRVKRYGSPLTLAPHTRGDVRGEYRRPWWKRKGANVSETLTINVDGEAVAPLQIRGTIK